MAKHNAIAYPIEQLRAWVSEGKTQEWIADELRKSFDPRVDRRLIQKVCRKHGIKCQRRGPRSAEGHPEWKGGRVLAKNGYWKIYKPDHPTCIAKTEARRQKSNGGYFRKYYYVWEHRLVMEEKIGRFLLDSEVVHHIDGDTNNNSPGNLELFESNGKHLKETIRGCVPKWTDEGKAKILASNSKAHRRAIKFLRSSIRRESGDDAPLSSQEIRRYLKRLGKSAIEVFETVSPHALPLF